MKTLYATILGLTLVSGSAFAAVTPTITDDDASIMNVGETYAPNHTHQYDAPLKVSDDDESVAQVGVEGGHVAHSEDAEAELFLPNDLSL